MNKFLNSKDLDFVNRICSDFFKIETPLDDYKKFVYLSLKYDLPNKLFLHFIEELSIKDIIQTWKDENPKFSNKDYIEFASNLIFETKNQLNVDNEQKFNETDWFTEKAKTLYSNIVYLLTNYVEKYSLSQILFIAIYSYLYPLIELEIIDNEIIEDELSHVFFANCFWVGISKEIQWKEFDQSWGENLIGFDIVLTKLIISALSFELPYENPLLSNKCIANLIEEKIEDIKEYFRKLMCDSFTISNYVDVKNRVEKIINYVTLTKELDKYSEDYLIDYINCPNIVGLQLLDLEEDFDGDGFGVQQAKELYKHISDKFDYHKEHEDYLKYLAQKWPVMMDFYTKMEPDMSAKTIETLKYAIYDAGAQAIAGVAYFFGLFVERDFKIARECFFRGYELGSPECAYQLSIMYLKQLDVSFNLDKWLFYLNKACILGDKNALDQWEELKKGYNTYFKGICLSPEIINLEVKISTRYRELLKERFLEIENEFISSYIKFDNDHKSNVYNQLVNADNFFVIVKLLNFIEEIKNKGINYEIAYEISTLINKIGSGRNNFNYDRMIRSGLRVNIDLDKTKLVDVCWCILAYDLGKQDIESEILREYGKERVLKNNYSDNLFCTMIMKTRNLSLFDSYIPKNKDVILELFYRYGLKKSAGYLIPIFINNKDFTSANYYGSIFLGVATNNEINNLLSYTMENFNSQVIDNTNLSKFLYRKNKKIKETTKKGCYIATCVYGSYNCPQVWTLRRYRDNKLDKTFFGRFFIKIYYFVSPTLIKCFGKSKWFKKLFKNKLDKLIIKYKKLGYSDEPYSDF